MSRLIVNQIQGDAVTKEVEIPTGYKLVAADGAGIYAPGGIVNAEQFVYSGTTSSTSTNLTVFDENITPKLSGSKFLISFEIKCSRTHNYSVYFQLGIDDVYTLYGQSTYPSASNSHYQEGYGSNHLWDASYTTYYGQYLYSHSGSSNFNIKVRSRSQGGTHYINYSYNYNDESRGRPVSTCTVLEIAQ